MKHILEDFLKNRIFPDPTARTHKPFGPKTGSVIDYLAESVIFLSNSS